MTNHPIQSWMEPTNTRLAKLAQLIGQDNLPDYVRKMGMDTLRPEGSTKIAAFADRTRLDYPCHTKAATYLSYADYKLLGSATKRASAEFEHRLNNMVDYYQIRHDVAAIDKLASEMNVGLPDDHYAMVKTSGEHKIRQLRIKDAKEIVEVIDFLRKNAYELNFAERRTIASNILDRREKLATALDLSDVEYLEKQAGRGEPVSSDDLVAGIEARSRHCKLAHPQLSEKLVKIAEEAKANTIYAPQHLLKLATSLEMVDACTGLFGNYTSRLPSPNDLVFAVTPTSKSAAMADICKTASGRVYHGADLRKVALADISRLMGTDFSADIRDGVTVCPERLQSKLASCSATERQCLEALFDQKAIRFTHA
jgi:hypothetical protein